MWCNDLVLSIIHCCSKWHRPLTLYASNKLWGQCHIGFTTSKVHLISLTKEYQLLFYINSSEDFFIMVFVNELDKAAVRSCFPLCSVFENFLKIFEKYSKKQIIKPLKKVNIYTFNSEMQVLLLCFLSNDHRKC